MVYRVVIGLVVVGVLALAGAQVWAQDAPSVAPPAPAATPPVPATPPPAPAATAPAPAPAPVPAESAEPTGAAVADEVVGEKAPSQVTLLLMVWWGGWILWITMALGFIALVMAIYFALTVTPTREVPANFARRVLTQIKAGDLRGAYQLCEGREELLAKVVRAGLKASGHDRYVIQEAMESEGERGVTALWQKISYLNNIGTTAPLLGLLGTVWGMVLAFSNIAADDAQVRGMVVAENVSKALITTVGGLVVAIPCMVVYYFLRGRVIRIVAEVEAQASEVVELLTRGRES
ncbi:MAG: MotA/TolQ/ExbB proton channel family protein [Candidatus Hydrogenedentes bacterium]|nr:MotA/TolQ/ExbB proton channel family protein [Candidatus Hydrogenedentota bacterium]